MCGIVGYVGVKQADGPDDAPQKQQKRQQQKAGGHLLDLQALLGDRPRQAGLDHLQAVLHVDLGQRRVGAGDISQGQCRRFAPSEEITRHQQEQDDHGKGKAQLLESTHACSR